MQPLTVLSHLRPRFADIPDNYGHARSRRRASARHGEAPLQYRNTQNPNIQWLDSSSGASGATVGLKGEIQCNVRVVQRTRAAHDNRLNGYPLPHADDFTYQLHVCCIPAYIKIVEVTSNLISVPGRGKTIVGVRPHLRHGSVTPTFPGNNILPYSRAACTSSFI